MSLFFVGRYLTHNTILGFIYLGVLILNLFTILYMIFVDKRTPQKILLWVITMICFPIIGFIFFLFLGKGPSIGKRRKFLKKMKSDIRYREELYKQSYSIENSDPIENGEVVDLIQYNIRQNSSICTFVNEVKVYTDIEEQYDDMYRDIENATESVNFQYFIIKPDEIGKRFRDILTKKAREGLTVRVMYDDFGSIHMHKRFFKRLMQAGGKVYRFMPSLFRFVSRNVNYRNHRKNVVIDRKIAYTGGANIGKEYLSKHRRIKPWRDTQIRVKGKAVDLLNMNFMQDYNFVSGTEEIVPAQTELATSKILPMQIVSDGPDNTDVNGIEEAYTKAIYSAKKNVYIETPYFVPTTGIMNALCTAARSGVDVRVIVPKVPDKPIPYRCTLSFINDLVEAGIKVYRWKGFIHSKMLVIDDVITSIGTVNIDYRSLRLHFEMTAFIYSDEFGRAMREVFENDLRDSEPYTLEDVAKRNIFEKLLQRIMRLFAPLM